MRERIIEFLEVQGLSPARFADEIGVQRSSISHIISGRNNPSFDFILKILTKYKFLNAEWLMRGTGEMFNNQEKEIAKKISTESFTQSNIFSKVKDEQKVENKSTFKPLVTSSDLTVSSIKKIAKVILFYEDKTFTSFSPED